MGGIEKALTALRRRYYVKQMAPERITGNPSVPDQPSDCSTAKLAIRLAAKYDLDSRASGMVAEASHVTSTVHLD